VKIGRNKGRGGWLFLASVVAGYGVTALVEAGKARAALAAFLPMLGTVAPVLLLVLMLMILSERFFTPRRVERWLGRDSDLRAWLIAAGAGAIANRAGLPLVRAPRRPAPQGDATRADRGAPLRPRHQAASAAAHGPYFGAPFTLVLSGWTLAFAWLSGLVIRRFAAEAAS